MLDFWVVKKILNLSEITQSYLAHALWHGVSPPLMTLALAPQARVYLTPAIPQFRRVFFVRYFIVQTTDRALDAPHQCLGALMKRKAEQ